MTYGHDAVIPMEIVVPFLRVMQQNELSIEKFTQAMIMELENFDKERRRIFDKMVIQKKTIARAYNKRVKKKRY